MGHERVTAENVNRPLPPGIDRTPGGYRARIYGPDRKRKTVGIYPQLKDAIDALAEARTDVRRGEYIDRKRAQITLDAWIAEWMPARNIRANTLHADQRRYRLHIKPHLGGVPLVKLTPYRVSTWLAALTRAGTGPATIKKAHTLLSTALGVHGAIGDRRLTLNPCQVVRPKTPPRPQWTLPTRQQIDAALGHLDAETACMALLAAFAGLRWSEIAGLQRADYNPLRATLTVSRSITYNGTAGYVHGTTKSARPRTIPLAPRLTAALNTHLTGHTGTLIFTHNGGPVPSYRTAWRWNKACRQAGFHARFHDLRHSCASHLLHTGATLAEVRDTLGHASITTTELYLHVGEDSLRDAVTRAFG